MKASVAQANIVAAAMLTILFLYYHVMFMTSTTDDDFSISGGRGLATDAGAAVPGNAPRVMSSFQKSSEKREGPAAFSRLKLFGKTQHDDPNNQPPSSNNNGLIEAIGVPVGPVQSNEESPPRHPSTEREVYDELKKYDDSQHVHLRSSFEDKADRDSKRAPIPPSPLPVAPFHNSKESFASNEGVLPAGEEAVKDKAHLEKELASLLGKLGVDPAKAQSLMSSEGVVKHEGGLEEHQQQLGHHVPKVGEGGVDNAAQAALVQKLMRQIGADVHPNVAEGHHVEGAAYPQDAVGEVHLSENGPGVVKGEDVALPQHHLYAGEHVREGSPFEHQGDSHVNEPQYHQAPSFIQQASEILHSGGRGGYEGHGNGDSRDILKILQALYGSQEQHQEHPQQHHLLHPLAQIAGEEQYGDHHDMFSNHLGRRTGERYGAEAGESEDYLAKLLGAVRGEGVLQRGDDGGYDHLSHGEDAADHLHLSHDDDALQHVGAIHREGHSSEMDEESERKRKAASALSALLKSSRAASGGNGSFHNSRGVASAFGRHQADDDDEFQNNRHSFSEY